MSVFVYIVNCNSTLESVVGKIDNTAIRKKVFLPFVFFILIRSRSNLEVRLFLNSVRNNFLPVKANIHNI